MCVLTSCLLSLLLVLPLLLGLFSCLFMSLVIWIIRLLEKGLQIFRRQTVPEHPLGNAVCNTT